MQVVVGFNLQNTDLKLFAASGDVIYDLPFEITDFKGGVVECDVTELPRQSYQLEAHAEREGVTYKLPPAGFAHFTLPADRSGVDVSENTRVPSGLEVKLGCNLVMHLKVTNPHMPPLRDPVVHLDGMMVEAVLSDIVAGMISFRLPKMSVIGEHEVYITDGDEYYAVVILTVKPDIFGAARARVVMRENLTGTGVVEEVEASHTPWVFDLLDGHFTWGEHTHPWEEMLEEDGAGYVTERMRVLNNEADTQGWRWLGEPHNSLIVSQELIDDAEAFKAYASKAAIIGCKCKFEEKHV